MQHNWTQIWRVDSKTKSNNVFILQILSWKVKIRWDLILESDQTDVKINNSFCCFYNSTILSDVQGDFISFWAHQPHSLY